MSNALDLVMMVIDQSETYQAPQAARAVDDVYMPVDHTVRCWFCGLPAAPGHGHSIVRTCGAPECQAKRHERRQQRRRAETEASSVRGTYDTRHRDRHRNKKEG